MESTAPTAAPVKEPIKVFSPINFHDDDNTCDIVMPALSSGSEKYPLGSVYVTGFAFAYRYLCKLIGS